MYSGQNTLEVTLKKIRTTSVVQTIYPWLVITLCGAFLIYKYILQVYPSIMTKELMNTFQIHGAGLGNLAATFFYSYLITQAFVGILLDKYSTRFLSALAIFIGAVGVIIFAQAETLWVATIARAMMGVSAAFATVSYLKLATVWFKPKQFAFISGLLATAAMTGAVFGQAPLSILTNFVGWRHALYICGIIGVVVAFLFFLIVRNHNPANKEEIHTQYKLRWVDIKEVICSKQNWLLTFYSGLVFSPVAVFGGLWGNPFLEETHQLTKTAAATFISLIFMGLAVGGPIFGWLSDYIFKRRIPVMFAGTFSALLALFIVIYMNNIPLWLLGVLLFVFGFSTGAFMLCFALGKEINKIALVATVIAFINSGDAILGSITEPLIGKILDLGWSGKYVAGAPFFTVPDFHKALVLLPAYLIFALIILFFLHETPTRPTR